MTLRKDSWLKTGRLVLCVLRANGPLAGQADPSSPQGLQVGSESTGRRWQMMERVDMVSVVSLAVTIIECLFADHWGQAESPPASPRGAGVRGPHWKNRSD
jgi:hypothetical protein